VAAPPELLHGGAKSGCQKQIRLFVQGVLNAAILALAMTTEVSYRAAATSDIDCLVAVDAGLAAG
jgi:hypothetical protein